MTSAKTAPAKTAAKKSKKERVVVPKHKLAVDKAYRKNIVRSVTGKATSVRDEQGKKMNRLHTVKYVSGKRTIVSTMRIIYGRELIAHKDKNITELTNSRGSVYYFVPVAK